MKPLTAKAVTIAAFDKNGQVKATMKVEEKWADRIEKLTGNKIRRISVEEEAPPQRRPRRPRKTEE